MRPWEPQRAVAVELVVVELVLLLLLLLPWWWWRTAVAALELLVLVLVLRAAQKRTKLSPGPLVAAASAPSHARCRRVARESSTAAR